MKPDSALITINGGSSSIKFVSFQAGGEFRRIQSGEIERIGLPRASLRLKLSAEANEETHPVSAPDYAAAVETLLSWPIGKVLESLGGLPLAALGHRLVQGGPKHVKPERLTPDLIDELKKQIPFDAVHLPGEILLLEAFYRRFPQLPQVVCFDTAFHQSLPRVAQLLPIPRRFEAKGVRRYGFHGLSYQFLMEELLRLGEPAATKGRVILAHLGSGASLAAVLDGKSIDTSMSFTTCSGIPMGTRSGDLDPALARYLQIVEGMEPMQFHEMVTFKSGLLGISETSSDMRDLLAQEPRDVRSSEAIEMFCYHVKKAIGAFAAALGGVDTLVFSGGTGQNAPTIRARICANLSFLGIELDPDQKKASEGTISKRDSRVVVRVIRSDEERVIAQTVCQVLGFDREREI